MQRRKILIVEDDKPLRETLAELLTDEGFPVTLASDGEVALQNLKAAGDWLVLLDFTLPKVSGQKILHQLKTNPRLARDNQVILISSLLERANAHSLLSDLVVAVLPKPFHFHELLETIAHVNQNAPVTG